MGENIVLPKCHEHKICFSCGGESYLNEESFKNDEC